MKAAELETTQALIAEHAETLGISLDARRIFSALLENDTIGDYLKGDLHLDGAIDLIFDGALKADIDPLEFLELMDLFHRIDAGSYPFLKSRFFKGESLDRKDESLILALKDRVEKVQDAEEVFWGLSVDFDQDAFEEHLLPLTDYLHLEHLRMLRSSPSRLMQDRPKRILKALKHLYKEMIKRSDDPSVLPKYQEMCANDSLGRRR
ncbi:MAG: hypothetical protein SP1CHLAM54_10560 [Chlamydiia bacterium]|nr:hypothetical protein [Chlamydiia bacterium]MCH9615961.1 hypothetical protein [Chlamydiia bacterium]MCH9628636.1 hypothetical protein [Chlamydiia bacterium]